MKNLLILVFVAAAGCTALGGQKNEYVLPEPGPDGFISLFNGTDLEGWVGDTRGYQPLNGILAANPRGNLYTKAEFDDFIFQFEFKLTPGANNGVGIRVPLYRRASKEGMEIQILDNSAEKNANVKPYQVHGSIYGYVGAKTGYLKPVGEWNYQEIRVEGPRVKVTLNGTVILDTDITPFREGEPVPDGKERPGVNQTRGHISFAGHKSQLWFRNLRVKPL